MDKKDNKKKNKQTFSSFGDLAGIFGLEKPKEKKSDRKFSIVSEKEISYAETKPIKRTTNLNVKPARKQSVKSGNVYIKKQNDIFNNKPTAPYNFVPLNDVVVHPPLYQYVEYLKEKQDIQNGYKKFLQEKGKYSGYFDIDAENITPLFIGGENKKFFSIGGRYCIPGSSMRGCLKNIFKIITNGAVRVKTDENSEADVTDKILYFRNLAGKKVDPTKDLYSSRFTHDKTYKDKNGNVKTKKESIAKAGFLVRSGKEYFICRADLKKENGKKLHIDVNPSNVPCIKWNNDYVDIFTGKMNNKKHFYRIKSPVWKDKYVIPDNVMKGYRDDKNRKGLDLLNVENAAKGADYKFLHGAEKFDYIVPCFYVGKDGIVEHFGAGPYYRLPYRKSIGDHIPDELKEARTDFADAVFGNKEYWSSRIYFEDCYLQGDKSVLEKEECSEILMGPNPTSFQFYLDTDEEGKPSHWEGNTDIRGYKFYWHRKIDWRAEKNKNENMNNIIAPVKPHNHFKGRICFNNLDEIELGALSYVIGLCEEKDICYKIGMGKPIGMGSIKITGRLYLRGSNYYKRLFAGDGFDEDLIRKDKEEYVNLFNAYMKKNLTPQSLSKYQARMKQLKTVLSTEYMQGSKQKEWNEENTRYMEIGNKNDRNIVVSRTPLPTIEEVVKDFK